MNMKNPYSNGHSSAISSNPCTLGYCVNNITIHLGSYATNLYSIKTQKISINKYRYYLDTDKDKLPKIWSDVTPVTFTGCKNTWEASSNKRIMKLHG